MAHEGYHEPVDKLSAATMDFHRPVESLIEGSKRSRSPTIADG